MLAPSDGGHTTKRAPMDGGRPPSEQKWNEQKAFPHPAGDGARMTIGGGNYM